MIRTTINRVLLLLFFVGLQSVYATNSFDVDRVYNRATLLYESCQEALAIEPVLDFGTKSYSVAYDRVQLYGLCQTYSAVELQLISDICNMRDNVAEFPDSERMLSHPKKFGREVAEAIVYAEMRIIRDVVSILYSKKISLV